jgi:hypothetical protein
LKGRLLHLTKLGVFPEGITSDDYQQLHEQLASSKRGIEVLEAAGRPVVGEDEADDIANVELGPVRPATNLPQGMQIQDGREINTVSGDLSHGAEVLRAGQGAGQLSLSQAYQRLPHPLAQLIKEILIVDGLDVRMLWEFLHSLLKIKQVARTSGMALYEIMYPFCRGEVFAFVTDAISTNASFKQFHASLLRRFVPVRQITRLRVERYERVQGERESLGF